MVVVPHCSHYWRETVVCRQLGENLSSPLFSLCFSLCFSLSALTASGDL